MEKHDIQRKVKEAQEFCEEVRKYTKENIHFEGKTLSEWRREFWINVPEDMTFATLSNLSAYVAVKYQHASYFRDMQNVSLVVLEQTQKDKYNETFNSTRTNHLEKTGKPLAADSCKVAASVAVKDIEEAISNQRIIKDFWTKTCETLVEVRKMLEMSGRALYGDSQLNKDIIIKGDK